MILLFLAFVIILACLVIFYNFGFFIAAKLCHYEIEEFGLGFPPRLTTFVIGRTRFVWNLLPLGGYITATNVTLSLKSLVFKCCGPLAVLVIFFVFTLMHLMVGMGVPNGQGAIVLESTPGGYASNLLSRDIITKAGGQVIHDGLDLNRQILSWHEGELKLEVTRNEGSQQINLVRMNTDKKDGSQGVDLVFTSTIDTRRFDPFSALEKTPITAFKSVIGAGAFTVLTFTSSVIDGLTKIFWNYERNFELLRGVALLAFFLAFCNLAPLPGMVGNQTLVDAIQLIWGPNQKKSKSKLAILLALVFFWIPVVALVVFAFISDWLWPNSIEQILRWSEFNILWKL